jgi:hypothetical protein
MCTKSYNVGLYKANVHALGSSLGVYSAAMHMFGFYSFWWSILLFWCEAVMDIFVLLNSVTLLGGHQLCLLVKKREDKGTSAKAACRRKKYTRSQIYTVLQDAPIQYYSL